MPFYFWIYVVGHEILFSIQFLHVTSSNSNPKISTKDVLRHKITEKNEYVWKQGLCQGVSFQMGGQGSVTFHLPTG